MQEAYSKAGSVAFQAFRGIATVMINNGQDSEDKRYRAFLEHVRKVSRKIAKINGLGVGIVTFFFLSVRTPVFYYGGVLVLNGQMQAGDAIATFLQISSGVMFLGNVLIYLQSTSEAQGAAQKVFKIIESKPKLDIASNEGLVPASSRGTIEFRKVSFAYPSRPDAPILRNFSLTIEAGETIALVGPSGSGKSTIFQLLMRIYEPNSMSPFSCELISYRIGGDIFFDGENIKNINLRWLRENMSIVSQEPVLFDKTLAENISLGGASSRQPTKEEVEEACSAANVSEFLHKFPKGLDTRIMRGTTLSGGQKQRIAIARAIVRKPRLLMLDEATSALDSRSERVVQSAIDKLAKNQTTLMIAHRLSTVRNADRIVVVEQGRVVETGSHAELMARQSMYYHMVSAQELGSGESVSDTNSDVLHSSVPLSEDLIQITPDDHEKRMTSTSRTSRREHSAKTLDRLPDEIRENLAKQPFPFKKVFQISRPDLKYIIIGLIGSLCDGAV